MHSSLSEHKWHSFRIVFSSRNQHLFDEFLWSFTPSDVSVAIVALRPDNALEDVIFINISRVILKIINFCYTNLNNLLLNQWL